MAILVDTNILLRLTQQAHPHSALTVRALKVLEERSETLHMTQQNLVEFWAVATRPLRDNGLGLSARQAMREVGDFNRLFDLLPEVPLHTEWLRIVLAYGVSGKNVHDARLVAAMTVHGIDQILTFNVPDFVRYSEIVVLDPARVA